MRKQQLVSFLNLFAASIGAAGLLAPGATQRLFGAVPTVETNGATRMISTRNLVLAALASRSDEKTVDEMLKLGAAMNLIDAGTTIATGLKHRELPRRHIVSLAATTSAFAAVELYALQLR